LKALVTVQIIERVTHDHAADGSVVDRFVQPRKGLIEITETVMNHRNLKSADTRALKARNQISEHPVRFIAFSDTR
jgi:hypothetical protein